MNVVVSQSKEWKPVLRGRRYCSPACGAGCTHNAFLRAKTKGNDLAAQLGKKWKVKVWENLGWHYCVAHRTLGITVYPQSDRTFWATTPLGMNGGNQYTGQGPTPQHAMQSMLRAIMEEFRRLQSLKNNLIEFNATTNEER